VFNGPGINDDGSGIVGILEVATQLTGYAVNNSVRLGFWAAEEFGLLGSYHYTENLSPEEAAKIRLYLNFDMIASPNYILGIYDGDGSAFNQTGPAGSAEAEVFFEEFFAANGLNSVPTDFSGRSDYAGFLNLGIASGGLFTGAEVVKTEEEAELFGGEAGVSYDVNYHQAGDNMTNLAFDAFEWNTKAIAAAVAEYATSFESLGPVNGTATVNRKRSVPAHKHNHEGGCGRKLQ
jgi:carboxypeptidase Q